MHRYADDMRARFGLDGDSHVIELASNDGYLLQWFVEAGVPVLGIEPAANVAGSGRSEGRADARQVLRAEARAAARRRDGRMADLLIGNNVLAQVPDLNDFVAGMKTILAPTGVITLEFPHVMRLIDENQFDTIYHEHFSYFSLHTVVTILADHGLEVFDVDELPTHGGSLRIYVRHDDDLSHPVERSVKELLAREDAFGLTDIGRYTQFAAQVEETKRDILDLLIGLKRQGKTHRRVRRARQGQHAPQLLRHPHGLPRLHRRPQRRTSRVCTCRARTSRSSNRKRSTVVVPTTCSSFRGT